VAARVTARASERRSLLAAVVAAALFAVLLGAWFASGWSDVRARQRELRAEPTREVERQTAALAHDLRGELQRLIQRELARPYYHYGNLFHDPKAGTTTSVTPSPLAARSDDSLVLGYFAIDPRGKVSTPTINDEVPELSDARNLVAQRAFRDEVGRSLARVLTGRDATQVARVDPPKQQAREVIQVDNNTYIQNQALNANSIYQQQNPQIAQKLAPQPVAVPSDAPAVPIVQSAFEWQTHAYAGAPALVAVRKVETPDGTLVQGFVVDRAALTSWLAGRAGAAVAELRTGDEDAAAEIAPNWHLAVTANPQALVEAGREAGVIARDFLIRFIGVGLVAALAFAFIVALVVRAERMARERSQFAAAAAHELRTPLAGLQLYGEMLAEGLGDPAKLGDYARRMSEEASRLGRVVSNVLGFSQLERGNLTLAVESRDLAAALAAIAERAQPALDRAGAALAFEVAPELRARFDPDALARIVGNLLDNAEKYSRDAEDRLIELDARAVGGGRVEIAVTDHGAGVAPAARRKLFRAFARGVDADGPAGLGLGLALSRSLAREMGGELAYAPDPRGTRFVVTLATDP
jgi:signal transduction histidine kinase